MAAPGPHRSAPLPPDQAARREWNKQLGHSRPTPGAPQAGALPNQLLAQYRSAQLLASLRLKPAQLDAVWLPPVTQPQLIVQLRGVTRLALTRHGQAHQYHVQPGSIFLNTAQQLPYELAWQSVDAEAIWSLELNLAPGLLQQTATAAGLEADRLELVAGPCLTDPLVHQLGVSLAAALQAPQPADSLYVDTITQMLATQLVHRHSAQPVRATGRPSSLSPARYRQVEEYVQASLSQVITLEQLAAIACLSPYHFCRVFRQTTGLSPHQYVTAQRLDRARHLLQHSTLPIAQIARAVGYHSASHFARLFQRHTGGLPSQWRP